jgi:hypothetical protein
VVIVKLDHWLGGSVVLVNPDASEIKLPMLNLKITENVMDFETHGNGFCYWSLTLQRNNKRGLLHGSCGEMLVDEPVWKRPPTRKTTDGNRR